MVPYSGIDLAGYETLKNIMSSYRGRRLKNRELFFVSCVACLIAQCVTYPLAILTTRMQADSSPPGKGRTLTQFSKDIWQYEGVRGFYRGLFPNLIKFLPVVGITFITYEETIKLLNISMT